MTDLHEWLDGAPVQADDVVWALAVTSSLGCGFSVRIPYGAADRSPVANAHARATRVAELFGADLDEAPWQELLAGDAPAGPLEVTGVWEPVFRGSLGRPRTRVTALDAAPSDRVAAPVPLPWTYGTATATAGLPVLAVHEEAVVTAHLRAAAPGGGPVVGLWRDASDRICTSSAGPLLAYDGERGWEHPSPVRRPVGHWLHDQLVRVLESRPTDDLGAAAERPGPSLWAVDAVGSLTALGPVDDAASAALAQARDGLLPGATGADRTPPSTSAPN